MCLHWSWVLGIAKAMVIQDDEFSYGQVLYWFLLLVVPFFMIRFLLDYVSFYNYPTVDGGGQTRSSSLEIPPFVPQESSRVVQRGYTISDYRITEPLALA